MLWVIPDCPPIYQYIRTLIIHKEKKIWMFIWCGTKLYYLGSNLIISTRIDRDINKERPGINSISDISVYAILSSLY